MNHSYIHCSVKFELKDESLQRDDWSVQKCAKKSSSSVRILTQREICYLRV